MNKNLLLTTALLISANGFAELPKSAAEFGDRVSKSTREFSDKTRASVAEWLDEKLPEAKRALPANTAVPGEDSTHTAVGTNKSDSRNDSKVDTDAKVEASIFAPVVALAFLAKDKVSSGASWTMTKTIDGANWIGTQGALAKDKVAAGGSWAKAQGANAITIANNNRLYTAAGVTIIVGLSLAAYKMYNKGVEIEEENEEVVETTEEVA